MKLKHILAVAAFIMTSSVAFCQNQVSSSQLSPKFIKAMELYELHNYTAAMNLFEDLSSNNIQATYFEKSSSSYYLAMCHKLVGDTNLAEIYFNNFLVNYPENIHNNEARFAMGQIQFGNKSYKTALETFQSIDTKNIDSDLLDEYYYKVGYCYLKGKKTEEAKNALYKAIGNNSEYSDAATYYYATIIYDENNYDAALKYFNTLTDNPDFRNPSLQYITRINSVKRQYDAVIDAYDKELIGTSKKEKKDNQENIKIFADAFYKTGNFDKAIELYESVSNSLSPEESYQLAYSYYTKKEYNKAIPYFENAADNKDVLSQNALYHIGVCQMKTNNKNFAATAFHNAYKLQHDKEISEKSLFNYVKLVYESGIDPYNDALAILQNYINENPDSERKEEAYSYLAKLFISTNNYRQALEAIESLNSLTPELKSAYQKINYSSGISSFNNKKYTNAITLLEKSKTYPQDQQLAADATYWIGESYYRQNKLDKAKANYKAFIEMPNAKKSTYYNTAKYSLGYCNFKQKDYKSAENYFNQFVKSENQNSAPTIVADAYNRIGDCNFIQQKHNNAITAYDKAMSYSGNQNDYSLYYKALAYGAMNKLSDKISTLKQIVAMPKQTSMRNSALFELGNTYTLTNKTSEAIDTYNKFISEYPKNVLVGKAKQKLGMLYYNKNDNAKAIEQFKDVVTKYPGSKEASECLVLLKNIYVEEGNVDDYLNFTNNTANIKTSTSEADSLSYAAVQNLYLSGQGNKTKDACIAYLNKYPNGSYVSDVNFYLGECLFNEKKYDEALKHYAVVYNGAPSIYAENARLKAAKIQRYKKNYNSAASLFEQVISNAEYDYIIDDANTELMYCYYYLPDYQKLLAVSETVMNNQSNANEIKDDAKYYHAQALYNLGKTDKAYTEFAEIAAGNQGERSAEAKYLCGLIKYNKAQYDEAETETFDLIQNYGEYDYWYAKGFILLADIYTKTGNEFQAKQTLQSIIDNYQGQDLKDEAQAKLNALNKNE